MKTKNDSFFLSFIFDFILKNEWTNDTRIQKDFLFRLNSLHFALCAESYK